MTTSKTDDDSEEAATTNAVLELLHAAATEGGDNGEVIWNELELDIKTPLAARGFSTGSDPVLGVRPIVGRSTHLIPSALFRLTLQRQEERLSLFVEPHQSPLRAVYVRRAGESSVLRPPEISPSTESEVSLGSVALGLNHFEIELHADRVCEVLLLHVNLRET